MTEQITVLGAGRLGSALIRSLLSNGHEVTVWNRSREKLEPLRSLGARAAASIEEAVQGAGLIISVVIDYDASDQLLRGERVTRALRGKTLVQLSSGSPAQARAAAAWAHEHGIDYLDGAVMATPDFIGTAGCTILYGGPRGVFERVKHALLALGGNPQHVGEDAGHASAIDSALLVCMWGELFGALQAAALCQAEGIALGSFRRYLEATMPVIDAGVLEVVTRIENEKLAGDQDTHATLQAHYGAFQHMAELSRTHGLSSAIPDAFSELFELAMRAGHADDDFAVLSRFMRP